MGEPLLLPHCAAKPAQKAGGGEQTNTQARHTQTSAADQAAVRPGVALIRSGAVAVVPLQPNWIEAMPGRWKSDDTVQTWCGTLHVS